jgi:hypothetical protein
MSVCATGAVTPPVLRRPGVCWTKLAWRFGSSVVGPCRSGAAKTAGSAPLLAAARRLARLGGQAGRQGGWGANGGLPPWLLFVQT